MSIWIKFFYAAMPVCMILQTTATLWMAWMVTKIACRKRRHHER